MNIRKLTLDEFLPFYRDRVFKDFSKSELKEIDKIKELYPKDLFICYVIEVELKIIGYIILSSSNDKKAKLLEYFVMDKSVRNKGYGSIFLKEVLDKVNCQLYLEVEDPKDTEDIKEKEIRTRRINFYKRNGIYKTPLKVKMYKGKYRVLGNLVKPCHKTIDEETISFNIDVTKNDLTSIYTEVKTIEANLDDNKINDLFIVDNL